MQIWLMMCLAASIVQNSLQHCAVEISPSTNQYKCNGAILCDECPNNDMKMEFTTKCRETRSESPHYPYYNHYNFESYSSSLKIIGNVHDCFLENIQPFIKSIDLSSNEFSVIPIFPQNHDLKTLNLSRNLITEISSSIQHFQIVDLSYNEVSMLYLEMSWEGHLETLNLSHNKITFISPSFFSTSLIQWLDLSHNKLINLDDQVWTTSLIILDLSFNELKEMKFSSSLPSISKLKLNKNHITEFCIDDSTFDSLKFLDLSFNEINLIEGCFRLRNLRTLNLSNNLITSFKNSFDSTSLSVIDLSNNEISELASKTFNNNNLSGFLIGNNMLKGRLSKGMLLGLTYVPELDLYGQNIVAIDDYAFFGALNIIFLNCSWNNIYNISSLAFRSLNRLETLDLSRNKISNIDFDKSDLLQLKWLSVRDNKITTLSNKTFEDIGSLVYLDISMNEIFDIQSASFNELQHLATLSLIGNQLGHILKSRSFSGLRSLTELTIVGTNISKVENDSFYAMEETQKLDLSNNKLCELEYNAFVGINALVILDLSSNLLKELHINVTSLKNLEILFLDRNQIKAFNSEDAFPRLNKLSISRNKFNEFGMASSSFRNLTYLDLSFNPMRNICLDFTQLTMLKSLIAKGTGLLDFRQCLNMKNLQILNFQYSEIQLLCNLAIPDLSSLQTFDLSNNVIQNISTYDLDKTRNIITLNLHNNSIHEIEPGSFLNLLYLRSINISKNKIKFIKFGTFNGLTQLELLDLSFNSINTLNPHLFHVMPNLKELSVDHNILTDLDFVYSFNETNVWRVSIGSNLIPCAEIVKYKRLNAKYILTTSTYEIHTENVDGITCKSGMRSHEFLPAQNGSKFESNQFEFLRLMNELLVKIDNSVKQINVQKAGNIEIHQASKDVVNKDFIEMIKQSNHFNTNHSKMFQDLLDTNHQMLAKVHNLVEVDMNVYKILKKVENNSIPSQNSTAPNTLFTNHSSKINKLVVPDVDIRQEITDLFKVEKGNLVNVLKGELLADIKQRINDSSLTYKEIKHLNVTNSSNSMPFSNFVYLCSVFTAFFIICFLFYKLYNRTWRFYPRSSSTSIQVIPNNIELSDA